LIKRQTQIDYVHYKEQTLVRVTVTHSQLEIESVSKGVSKGVSLTFLLWPVASWLKACCFWLHFFAECAIN